MPPHGVPHPHPRAAKKSRRAARHRHKHPYRPPVIETPDTVIALPFDNSWRSYYADFSNIKCGPFALCEMLSVHYSRTFDPEIVWQDIHGTTGSSVWDNINWAKSHDLIKDFRFFRDDNGNSPVTNARLTLAQGLAFMVICNYYNSGHIWCVTGINDTRRTILSPQDWGSPHDIEVPFDDFNAMLMQEPPFTASPNFAICCVGLF